MSGNIKKQNYYLVEESLLRATIDLIENDTPIRVAQKALPILGGLKNSPQAVLDEKEPVKE
jgi:hypothetical protein